MNGVPGSSARDATAIRTAGAAPVSFGDSEDPPMSLDEAAAAFNVSKRTLLRALSFGDLHGVKVRGLRGQEWRVTAAQLTGAGFDRRSSVPETSASTCRSCERLRHELTAEQMRSRELDNQLGYALLANGRLRAQLAQVGIEPDQDWGVQTYPDER